MTRMKAVPAGATPLTEIWVQPEVVSGLIDAHINKRQYEVWTLWTLLVFHIWHALYIDGSLKLDHQLTPAELLPQFSSHVDGK